MRSGVLAEPRPQERVQRHTMEHIVDFVCIAPVVQIIGAPVPQTVEQLPNILHFFDTLMPDPEQVFEVTKILPDDVRIRTALRDTQLAEQLVEVPTIVSYSSYCSGLWSTTSTFQFLVVDGDSLVFKVFPLNRVQQRLRRRSLTFSFQVEVFKVFAQGKVHLLLTFQLVFMKTWMSLV